VQHRPTADDGSRGTSICWARNSGLARERDLAALFGFTVDFGAEAFRHTLGMITGRIAGSVIYGLTGARW
jgi:hypothetical protein